jgi:hypothetical protein
MREELRMRLKQVLSAYWWEAGAVKPLALP